MNIPDCYDPVYQEERRQAEADRAASRRPICDCCFRHVRPGSHYYTIAVQKEPCTICEDCKEELDESETHLEM